MIARGTYAKADWMGEMIPVPNAPARVCAARATTRRRKSPVVHLLRTRHKAPRMDDIEGSEDELLSQQEPCALQ